MSLDKYVIELGRRLDVSASVIDDYEAQVEDLTNRLNNLAADLLEERAQRHVAQAAYDSLRDASIEHTERHRLIFDEHLRQVAQLTDERDEVRAEVVRLGRELEQWKQAFGEDGLRVAKARLLDALGRSQRPWTDDEVTVKDDGTKSTRVHVKRACNGCGELLGDVTDEEMDRAIAGLPAEDVRGECLTCTPLPSTAVSLDALSREVVQLGRDTDRLDDLLGEARQQIIRDAKELVRLRTIIGEPGAAEAAEPPPIDITGLLLKHPPGPVTLTSLAAVADDEVSDATSRLRAALDEERIEGDQG